MPCLTEVKEHGKVDGVRVAAMMQSTFEGAGTPRYTSWAIAPAIGGWDRWLERRLVVERQRTEVTERDFRVPDQDHVAVQEQKEDGGRDDAEEDLRLDHGDEDGREPHSRNQSQSV
jgi:hypothetical protein